MPMTAAKRKRGYLSEGSLEQDDTSDIGSRSWVGLQLPDEILVMVLSKLGDELVLAASVTNDLLVVSQVNRRLRRLVHSQVARKCSIRQPHLSPSQPTSLCKLSHLPLHSYTAVTHLDLSQCLDWIQHPCLCSLADLSALRVMPQLRQVDLRPLLDHIDSSASGRIKTKANVLCWADGVMPRIWDRWMYAPPGVVSVLINIPTLADLTNLERISFPITERHHENPQQRLFIASALTRLTALNIGRATIDTDSLSCLQRATSLRCLSIGKCAGFTDAELQILASLPKLDTLYLYGCRGMELSASAWQPLSRLLSLRRLALYGRQEGENVHFWQTSEYHPQSLPLNAQAFETVCGLTTLQELRLGGCRELQGDTLLCVTKLSALSCLEVNSCPHVAYSVLSSIIQALPGLKRLNLRHVKGVRLIEELCEVSSLRSMQKLSLDLRVADAGVAAHAALLEAVLGLTTLRELLLWHSCAATMSLARACFVSRLQCLHRLSIKSCAVTTDLVHGIAEIRSLQSLELADCSEINNADLKALSKLSNLCNLDLYSAPLIGDEGLAHLAGCTKLLSFRMINSSITDKSLQIITKFRSLRNLSLEGAINLTDASLYLLPQLILLKILDLAGCRQLTDEGLIKLAVMGELRQLNLERCTSITNAGVHKFRARILLAGPAGHGGSGGIIVFF